MTLWTLLLFLCFTIRIAVSHPIVILTLTPFGTLSLKSNPLLRLNTKTQSSVDVDARFIFICLLYHFSVYCVYCVLRTLIKLETWCQNDSYPVHSFFPLFVTIWPDQFNLNIHKNFLPHSQCPVYAYCPPRPGLSPSSESRKYSRDVFQYFCLRNTEDRGTQSLLVPGGSSNLSSQPSKSRSWRH